jgi:hypothetical protein
MAKKIGKWTSASAISARTTAIDRFNSYKESGNWKKIATHSPFIRLCIFSLAAVRQPL